jgi:hypothetical protein
MQIFWGTVLVASSLLCWGGQTIVCFAPTTGARLGLSEREADVEPTFWADVRSEALWDFLTLWTLVAAGALLIIDQPAWWTRPSTSAVAHRSTSRARFSVTSVMCTR